METKFVEECMGRKDCPKFIISKIYAMDYTKILKKQDYDAIINFKFDNSDIYNTVNKGIIVTEKKDYVKVSELTWRMLQELYDAHPEVSEDQLLGYRAENPSKSKGEETKKSSNKKLGRDATIDDLIQSTQSQIKSEENKKKEYIKSKTLQDEKKIVLNAKEKMELCEKLVKEEQKSNKSALKQNESLINLPSNSKIQPVGLVNRGTYCFANSGLQCLLTVDHFIQYFLNSEYNSLKNKSIRKKHISLAFSRFLTDLSRKSSKSYLDHSEIRNIISQRFDPTIHHDCQEFIRFFLSEMQDEINSKPPKNYTLEDIKTSKLAKEKYFSCHDSIIDQTFAGLLKSQVTCHNCKNESITYDPFLDLSLHFNKSGSRKINTMLDEFFDDENINGYACEKCKKRSKATKSTSIAHLPPVLMIHLMRISMAPKKQKINEMIHYEKDGFTLKKFMSSDSTGAGSGYSLKAIAIHIGSPDFGHYIALCKRENKWYKFDDTTVTPIDESEILMNQAYILFYEQD